MENTNFSKNITSFDDHLDNKYGKFDLESRKVFEQGFETFKLGVILEEARKNNLAQQEYEIKFGIQKIYNNL